MLYIQTDANGRPSRWASSDFAGAAHTAPSNVDLQAIYFKSSEMRYLPEAPDDFYLWDLSSESWVPDEEAAWEALRIERNRTLAASDWTQVPDAPVDQAAWAAYRQQLRDLPSTTTDPFNVQWPQSPTETQKD